MVAFTLMDTDSDGLIGYKEVCTLILSILKVLCVQFVWSEQSQKPWRVPGDHGASGCQEAFSMFDLDPSEQVNMEIVAGSDYVKSPWVRWELTQ